MSDFSGLYDIREYTQDDKKFILATFLRGLYYGNSWFNSIPKQIFMDNYKLIAEKLIDSNKVSIRVACLKEDPSVILGYAVSSSDYLGLHWVYVKKAWRERHIASTLVTNYLQYVTHLSDLGKTILNSKFKDTVFNPFKL